MPNTNDESIVKAVFYAIVVSALVSAFFAVDSGSSISVGNLPNTICVTNGVMTINSNVAVNGNLTIGTQTKVADECSHYWIILAYFLFFSGYFYDEWRKPLRNNSECQSGQHKNPVLRFLFGCLRKHEIFEFFAWLVFICQSACVVKFLPYSYILGIVGTVVSTISFYANPAPWKISAKIGWLIQNLFWIAALLLMCHYTYLPCVLLGTASFIFLIKAYFWFTNEEDGGCGGTQGGKCSWCCNCYWWCGSL